MDVQNSTLIFARALSFPVILLLAIALSFMNPRFLLLPLINVILFLVAVLGMGAFGHPY